MSDSEEDIDISSGDDEDYVPGVESDESDDEGKVRRSKRKTPQKSLPKRSCRHGGIMLEDDSDDENDEEYISEVEEESEVEEDKEEDEGDLVEQKEKEEKEKKRIDDLWQNFKKDTGPSEKKRSDDDDQAEIKPSSEPSKAPKTVKITETYEFAGEEVKVTKEVAVDSAEAKKAEKSEENNTSKEGEVLAVGEKTNVQKTSKPTSSAPPKRRLGGGLSSVLGSINKKPKLSTLDKTKLDWEGYKEEEGISDELRSKSKSGYLDKQEFLQRADYRQWENEREMRLATSRFKK